MTIDPTHPFSLKNRRALVTGGSKGLGRHIAESLARAGADVVITGRRQETVSVVAEELARATGQKIVHAVGDMLDQEAPTRFLDVARERLGGIDILVNNAGVNIRGPIDQVTSADFDKVVGVNVKGPWLLCKAVTPIFKEQQFGRIINIASTLGMVGMADRTLYCASKGALVQLTRGLAMELAPWSVTVNAICPGPFETEMNRTLVNDSRLYREFAEKTALKRWGRLEEIGPSAVFLASEAAAYITGALLPIDGGWTAY